MKLRTQTPEKGLMEQGARWSSAETWGSLWQGCGAGSLGRSPRGAQMRSEDSASLKELSGGECRLQMN